MTGARAASAPMAPAVLVVGANGGSGASLVAGALALASVRSNVEAWLVELDIGRGDLGESWDLGHRRTIDDLLGVLGEVDAAHLGHAAIRHADGVQVILAPSVPDAARSWHPDAVECLVDAVRRAAGDKGRVIVDGGVGLAPSSLAVAPRAHVILVVCSSTVAAARRARRILDALATLGAGARCGLAVSHGPRAGEIGARALGRAVGAPVLAELPWSPREGLQLAAGRWPRGRRCRLGTAIASLSGAIG